MTSRQGAFSTALRDALAAAPAPARAVGVLPEVVHFATNNPDAPLLCLATPRAVRLPCSVVVPDLPMVTEGDEVWLGAGSLRVGDIEVRVGRWWRPPTPRLVDVDAARSRAAALDLPNCNALHESLGVVRGTGRCNPRLESCSGPVRG